MDRLKLAALGERLKTGSSEMGRKVSGKMKEILQGPSQEAKMVDEATSESLEEPNWGLNLRICGLLNSEEFNGSEVVRAIKKKIASKNPVSQRLSLDLLETCAMNCDKVFSEVASEKVLDEMVRMIDNPQTHYTTRRRALQLIEAWGESDDLAYLPIFKQTYMNMKAKKMPESMLDNQNSASSFSSAERGFDGHAMAPPGGYPYPNMDQQNIDPNALTYHYGPLPVEEKKEILDITRNSIEILTSLLNSEGGEEPNRDDLTLSMLKKCKESQPVIQRIIETIGDDETMLFDALNLNDELQQVLSRSEALGFTDHLSGVHTLANHSNGDRPRPKGASDEMEGAEQSTSPQGRSEPVIDGRNLEQGSIEAIADGRDFELKAEQKTPMGGKSGAIAAAGRELDKE